MTTSSYQQSVVNLAVKNAYISTKPTLINYLLNRLFPGGPKLLSLWIIYNNMLKRSLESESNYEARRLRIRELYFLLQSFKFEEENNINLNIISVFLRSLIIFQFDLKRSFKIPKPLIIPQNFDFKQILVPQNSSGNSCFCDVVLVAMFLSTTTYDLIFQKDNLFTYLWEDELFLKGLPEETMMENKITNSKCFLLQLERLQKMDMTVLEIQKKAIENTKKIASKLLDSLLVIAKNLRKTLTFRTLEEESVDLGEKVELFRILLAKECKWQEKLEQEDAAEFFETILGIGNFESAFFSMTRKIRIDSFSSQKQGHIFQKIPPFIRTFNNAPSWQTLEIDLFLKINAFKEGNSIQKLIDLEFLEEMSQTEHKKGIDNVFVSYMRSIDKTMVDTNELFLINEGFTVNTREVMRFIKVPKVFFFVLRRTVQRELPTGEKTLVRPATKVTIPEDEKITIPVFESNDKFHYRITAIACQIGSLDVGHYVLYFRYANLDQWLYYDDLRGKKGVVQVDIHAEGFHKKSIEKNAYLFWASRVL